MQPNAYYAIQPAFTGGEISKDVASRVDLDKYQLALLQAENATIRPYGAVRKRPGLIYCGAAKYPGRRAILRRFEFSVSISYLLEIGHNYIRVWRDGTYLGVELTTPYTESDLDKLRFVQSVDVLYICSGSYPVKKLLRYAESDWRIEDVAWTMPAYADVNMDEDLTITPSATTGTITLTAASDLFDSSQVGDTIKIEQRVDSASASLTQNTNGGIKTLTSDTITVGETWKIITHGTWGGTVYVDISYDDGETWEALRSYHGESDYNPTETGDVEEPCLARIRATVTSGTLTATLSSYPYTHTGYVKITSVESATSATAEVTKALGNTTATDDWYWCAWNATDGYPICATFFQDRLVLGGSAAFPQRVWMSKSGDYENFGVDKEDGTVTDDSSISADLLSQQSYTINHLDCGTDLVVMTEGNLWTISGAETVTPSSMTPRLQENYGSNDVVPMRVGSRIVYIQRRGSIIRDTGYSYDTDSYVGQDLTLLAKHLIKDREITGAAYAQEPDSVLYFVTDAGGLICLTYVPEQKVYGWSHFVTDGAFDAVCSIASGNNDVVYAVVKRTVNGSTVRYIERFDLDRSESTEQQDYTMMDSAKIYALKTPSASLTGLNHLEGKTVCVMGDGYLYDDATVSNGRITLPEKCSNIVVGLPYTMILEQPNWDAGATDTGTVQGRKKQIGGATLRLTNSFGGTLGPDAEHQNPIIYDANRMELGDSVLYTGDKRVNLAIGGFNYNGRTYLIHEEPYPFSLSAIIREVTFGG